MKTNLLFAFLLCLIMIFTLTCCKSGENNNDENNQTENPTTVADDSKVYRDNQNTVKSESISITENMINGNMTNSSGNNTKTPENTDTAKITTTVKTQSKTETSANKPGISTSNKQTETISSTSQNVYEIGNSDWDDID